MVGEKISALDLLYIFHYFYYNTDIDPSHYALRTIRKFENQFLVFEIYCGFMNIKK
jgi:hypothetical protein